MIEPNDMPHLVMRERNSRALSKEPGDVSVQRAHLTMADAYAARILALEKSGGH